MRRAQLLKAVKQKALEFDPEARVFLYGSRARGDHKRLSDWDFFVLTSYDFDRQKKLDLQKEFYWIELATDQLISSIIDSQSNFEKHRFMPLYQNIQEEGVAI